MPAVNFSPIFNGWQGFTPSGLPLTGGFVSTYVAGTSIPSPTYTTNAGNVAHSNPIQLGSDGRPPAEIWLLTTNAYKFVLFDSLMNPIETYDNIMGIINAPTSIWIDAGVAPTHINATQFTVPGNLTTTFQAGLRLQYTLTATQFYGSVVTSSFGAGVTTVTVLVDSAPLTPALNDVNISQLTPQDSAVPTTIQQAATFQKLATFSLGIATGANDNNGRGLTLSRSKPSTTTRGGTTNTDDPDLIIPLPVGFYSYELWAPIWSTSGAGGMKGLLFFSGTATGASTLTACFNTGVINSTATISLVSSIFNASPIVTGTGITGVDWINIRGTINVTVTGNFSFRWSLAAASGSGNVGVGAWMNCTRVA